MSFSVFGYAVRVVIAVGAKFGRRAGNGAGKAAAPCTRVQVAAALTSLSRKVPAAGVGDA
jgi:hypothetical protein